MSYSESYVLLHQEAYLFHGCLTQGLTSLRNASVNNKGIFYNAFFQLSIGLERLMKVNLIVAHMAQHQFKAPTEKELKKHCHDLAPLFEKLRKLPSGLTPHPLDAIRRRSLEWDILAHLGAFADKTRYFNLNTLGGTTAFVDPLSGWNALIQRIWQEDVTPHHRGRIAKQSRYLSSAMKGLVVVVGTDLEKQEMNLEQAVLLPAVQELVARHAVFHVLSIIRALGEQLGELGGQLDGLWRKAGHKDAVIPYMPDFFMFIPQEKRDILRKRRWP